MNPSAGSRPRIGLTLDAEPPGGYSRLPWYAIRENYCRAIARAGGLPLALPHEVALADAYLELLDGLVVTGGAFDLDPALYGDRDAPSDGHHQGAADRVRAQRSPTARSRAICRCSASAAASSCSTSRSAAT